jgi:hypothetical protein
MKIVTGRLEDNAEEVQRIVVFIGENRYRITESVDGKMTINKISDGLSDDIEYELRQDADLKNEALSIFDIMPLLRNVHKMLEVDFDEQDDVNKELMSDIVEMCQNIADDYWIYKRE